MWYVAYTGRGAGAGSQPAVAPMSDQTAVASAMLVEEFPYPLRLYVMFLEVTAFIHGEPSRFHVAALFMPGALSDPPPPPPPTTTTIVYFWCCCGPQTTDSSRLNKSIEHMALVKVMELSQSKHRGKQSPRAEGSRVGPLLPGGLPPGVALGERVAEVSALALLLSYLSFGHSAVTR